MRQLLAFALVCGALMLSGCSTQLYRSSNSNMSKTEVVLSQNNFRVIGTVGGSAMATRILGIGGLSRKSVRANAVAMMFENANLQGSQTVININVKQAHVGFPPFYWRTVYTATGTIIEFTSQYTANNVVSNQPTKTTNKKTHNREAMSIDNSENLPIEDSPSGNNAKNDIAPAMYEKRYKIGDVYKESGLKGVVVNVSDDGKSGKIMSLVSAYKRWSTLHNATNANNSQDGKSNCILINRHDTDFYPAVKFCSSMGSLWYLPSAKELAAIFENISIINSALRELLYDEISKTYSYWSSTEADSGNAIAIKNGQFAIIDKKTVAGVIAIAKF